MSSPIRLGTAALAALLVAVLIPACSGTKPIVCPPTNTFGPGVSLANLGGIEVTTLAGGTNALWALRRVGRRGAQTDLVEVDPTTGRIRGAPVPLPDLGSALTVGSSGVWVTTAPGFDKVGKPIGPGSLFHVDASSHRILARVRVGLSPDAVAVGGGAIWVANSSDNTVSRVDPAGNVIQATISVRDGPDKIFALAGSVWVQTNYEDAPLFRIDPKDNRATGVLHVGMKNAGLGAVWVVGPWAPNGALRRLDPATGKPVGPALGLDIQPVAVAIAGPDLWVAKFFFMCGRQPPIGPPAVSLAWFRVDPLTLRSLSGPVFVGADHNVGTPAFIDGSLWMRSNDGSQVFKIDLSKARRSPISPKISLPTPVHPSP